jgi:L-fucose mutarotase/ribose pyranase (RbsD/FucU family)
MDDQRKTSENGRIAPKNWSLIPLILGATLMNLSSASAGDWRSVLAERLPLYGHRNWVVIVDAAYPAQISQGIEMILCDDAQTDVGKGVLDRLSASKHVRPIIYVDRELNALSEHDAPGISDYRKQIGVALGSLKTSPLLHGKIIAKLGGAGKTFRILMLKTKLTLPYTSVFIQLDCGYWSDDAEKRLRKSMDR